MLALPIAAKIATVEVAAEPVIEAEPRSTNLMHKVICIHCFEFSSQNHTCAEFEDWKRENS